MKQKKEFVEYKCSKNTDAMLSSSYPLISTRLLFRRKSRKILFLFHRFLIFENDLYDSLIKKYLSIEFG